MNKSKLFIDFHVIQTVPPGCVNRDDTQSPKTAIYGGVRRARVSSQAWKRAMREMFKEHFDESELGVRTKYIVDLVLTECGEGVLREDVIEVINLASAKSDKPLVPTAKKPARKAGRQSGAGSENEGDPAGDNSETDALFFMGMGEVKSIAKLVTNWVKTGKIPENKPKREVILTALNQDKYNRSHAVDVALFGRMVAKAPELNSDASAQVAHSISTHTVETEYDFFVAADDRQPEGTTGAGMMGTLEFNSATLYRYATVAVHELFYGLAGNPAALAKAVGEFARAFITSMPTGKQNSFANRTLPDAVLVALRTDQPINFSGAFEIPVKATRDGGHAEQSAAKLAEYAGSVYGSFASLPDSAYVTATGDLLDTLGKRVSLAQLYDSLAAEISERFETAGDPCL